MEKRYYNYLYNCSIFELEEFLDKDIQEEVGLIRVGDDTGKKKYVICCVMDGYNCDVYKYLKNDILQVTVYDIVDKVYKLIGRPIDDISTLINNCDDKVWDIYAKGLTTTINQADSDMGKQLVSRYKPTSLAELSAWVAAIRPGFASLLETFINREPYSTGVKQLDELLSDSFSFMLYQESIMSYLVWLGIEEKETYDIIKKISKKKFKEEELKELKDKLIIGWKQQVGTEDGFENTWRVVNDAAKYSFNASHALSVAVDSLYGAYLKSHYPLEYFTVVLTLYSDDIERTAKLTNELKYFNIQLNDIKFSKSKAEYAMDKDTNSIFKGLDGVKYLNSQIADELFSLSQVQYDSYISLLVQILNQTSVNSRQLEILITLNFFSDFGNNKNLLRQTEIYKNIAKRKQFKKAELEKLGIPEYLIKKYAGKETPKMYSEIDTKGLVQALCERDEDVKNDTKLSVSEQIKAEVEYLGYTTYMNYDMDNDLYIVIDFKTYQNISKPYILIRCLWDGTEIKTKVINARFFQQNSFGLYSILRIKEFDYIKKHKKIGNEWQETDEEERVLGQNSYEVIKR